MPSTSHEGKVKRVWIGGQTAGLTAFSISAWKPTRLLAWIWNHSQPMLIAVGAPPQQHDLGKPARCREQQQRNPETAAVSSHAGEVVHQRVRVFASKSAVYASSAGGIEAKLSNARLH
jgi:hypothetical protein